MTNIVTPQELRIGNLVLIDNKYTCLDARILYAIAYGLLLNSPEPIPLTPEILEKCGFEERANNDYFWEGIFSTDSKHVIYIVHYTKSAKEIHAFGIQTFDESGNYDGLINFAWYIKHLHQLQNLIYALTGNELEVRL